VSERKRYKEEEEEEEGIAHLIISPIVLCIYTHYRNVLGLTTLILPELPNWFIIFVAIY